jgi:hypothetical protein
MKMNKTKELSSNIFFDMLDCLFSQFLAPPHSASCVGADFGGNICQNAKDFFSARAIQEKLDSRLTMFTVLLDNSHHIDLKYGCTYTIFIDTSKIEGVLFRPFLSALFAHQICHFAFLYELFLELGGETGITAHNNFINALAKIDKGYPSLEDTHFELISKMGKYPADHFTHGKASKIDYNSFFNDFMNHLDFLVNSKKLYK